MEILRLPAHSSYQNYVNPIIYMLGAATSFTAQVRRILRILRILQVRISSEGSRTTYNDWSHSLPLSILRLTLVDSLSLAKYISSYRKIGV